MKETVTVRTRTAALTLVVGIGIGLSALLTACTTPGRTAPPLSVPVSTITITSSATPTTTSGSPRPAATATGPASAEPTVSASAADRVDPDAPDGQCLDSHLAVSVQNDPTGSGAGQRLSYVVFRNTGDASCVLRGAPGVSLVGDGDGTQIGAAAGRATGGQAVTIAPGSYALASLSYPNIDKSGGAYGDGKGHDPTCGAKAVDGYRVYPPHSFRAYFSADKTYGCSTSLQALSVGTVEPPSKFADFTPRF